MVVMMSKMMMAMMVVLVATMMAPMIKQQNGIACEWKFYNSMCAICSALNSRRPPGGRQRASCSQSQSQSLQAAGRTAGAGRTHCAECAHATG